MDSQRPTRRAIWLTLSVAIVAIVVWYAIPVANGVVAAYSFRGDRAQAAWQTIVPVWGDAKKCGACHTIERDRLTTAKHVGIGCQSCHGALAGHENSPAGGTQTPSSAICLTCHTEAQGQPGNFLAITPGEHYVSACLSCHDPHTGISNRPPVVSHTLKGIPACVTCHGPDAFKERQIRHPNTSSADTYCLSCHLEGRGPEASATPTSSEEATTNG